MNKMYLEMHFSICNLIFFSVSFKFIYFNWRIITLHYCDGFCYTSTWISHRYTRVPPHPAPPSHLPPYPIPLGCLRALALCALLYARNFHWSSVLLMVMYMFQSYSLKSSHPLLLPLSLKVCSLYLGLLCCLACWIISTIFLNSVYMCVTSF